MYLPWDRQITSVGFMQRTLRSRLEAESTVESYLLSIFYWQIYVLIRLAFFSRTLGPMIIRGDAVSDLWFSGENVRTWKVRNCPDYVWPPRLRRENVRISKTTYEISKKCRKNICGVFFAPHPAKQFKKYNGLLYTHGRGQHWGFESMDRSKSSQVYRLKNLWIPIQA